ncbi:MAG TPA: MarR family transcriptional regulator [Gaiellaceae bacterium]
MTVSKPTPAPDDYVRAAALREALNSFRRSSEIVTSANGLTSRTYQLLLMIETARLGDGGAGLSELEERLQLGKSTVTELVVRTERRGLVRRELDPQRRGAILVRLTPKGRRQLAKAVAELGNERDRLIELLSRLAGDEAAESTA